MKTLLALVSFELLVAVSTAVAAANTAVVLAWDPNKEPDVAGYRLFYGTNGFTTVVNCGNVTNYAVGNLVIGPTYSFYITCYNTSGLESEPSNIVTYTVPPVLDSPATPESLNVRVQQ